MLNGRVTTSYASHPQLQHHFNNRKMPILLYREGRVHRKCWGQNRPGKKKWCGRVPGVPAVNDTRVSDVMNRSLPVPGLD